MDLDRPARVLLGRQRDVLHADVGLGVEDPGLDAGIDGSAHRRKVVAHDQDRAARRDGPEELLDPAPVSGPGDRGVHGRHVEVPATGLGRQPSESTRGDVRGGHRPSLFGKEEGVRAFAGPHIHRAAG